MGRTSVAEVSTLVRRTHRRKTGFPCERRLDGTSMDMTHELPDVSVNALSSGAAGRAEASMELLINTVQEAVSQVAPPRRNKALRALLQERLPTKRSPSY